MEEKEIWVTDYKEEKSLMLNHYNRIARQIAEEVKIQLTPEEEHLPAKTIIVNKEADDAYLQSRFYWDDLSAESLNRAMEYLNEAIEKDPNRAEPYAGIAQAWGGLARMGLASPEIAGPKIVREISEEHGLVAAYEEILPNMNLFITIPGSSPFSKK